MKIETKDHIGNATYVHVPNRLVLNSANAWIVSILIYHNARIRIPARYLRQLFRAVRVHLKTHPDFKLVQVSNRDGGQVNLWI